MFLPSELLLVNVNLNCEFLHLQCNNLLLVVAPWLINTDLIWAGVSERAITGFEAARGAH